MKHIAYVAHRSAERAQDAAETDDRATGPAESGPQESHAHWGLTRPWRLILALALLGGSVGCADQVLAGSGAQENGAAEADGAAGAEQGEGESGGGAAGGAQGAPGGTAPVEGTPGQEPDEGGASTDTDEPGDLPGGTGRAGEADPEAPTAGEEAPEGSDRVDQPNRTVPVDDPDPRAPGEETDAELDPVPAEEPIQEPSDELIDEPAPGEVDEEPAPPGDDTEEPLPPIEEPVGPMCGDGTCDAGETCATCPDCPCDGFCAPDGTCAPLLNPYKSCAQDAQCASDVCELCEAKTGKSFCVAPESKGLGDVCRLDLECAVGVCSSKGSAAPFGGVCAGNQGKCQCAIDADCLSTQYCNGIVNTAETACFSKQPQGGPCAEDRWCLSGACNLTQNTCL